MPGRRPGRGAGRASAPRWLPSTRGVRGRECNCQGSERVAFNNSGASMGTPVA